MNGRVYDYNIGRFLSVDPLIVDEANSQALNPYSYVMNNPLMYHDPTGYATEIKEEKIRQERPTTGSRIRKTIGTKTTTTVTNNTGAVTSQHVVTSYKNGNYSGASISYSNGKAVNATVYSGDKAGNSLTASMDINSLGEISKVSTLNKTVSENGESSIAHDDGPVMIMGYTEASGHALHGKYHAFALALDPQTDQAHIVRGGPTMSMMGMAFSGSAGSGSAVAGVGGNQSIGGSGFGAIRAADGKFSNLTPFDQPHKTLGYQMLGKANLPFSEIRSRMESFSRGINNKSVPYWPLGPNSNSFAFSFVESMGFSRPRPVLPSPGWDDKI